MKVFLDTNIVIDLLDKRPPFHIAATRIFTLAYNKEIELFVSPFTYATAAYLLRKNGPSQLRQLLRNLRQLVNVSVADERVVDDALASQFDDYEDALQYYSALTIDADIIITRNTKDFLRSSIPVYMPDEFLAKFF